MEARASSPVRETVGLDVRNNVGSLGERLHAFETLQCNAVEFRTHFFNHQSRRASRALSCADESLSERNIIIREGFYLEG